MPTAPPQTRALLVAWSDGRRERLRLAGAPFAEGGDARLFAIQGQPDLVAKMYRAPDAEARRRAKLEAMLASPPAERSVEHEGRHYAQLAWPQALVEPADGADGAPLGFVMPRVDLARAVDLELLLSARGRRAAGLPEAYRTRVTVAHNLAGVVASLHAVGDHVIDLKPANVHVHRGAFFVAMLDCDGFSIGSAGGARFPAHQYTDGYIAPEALRARAKPEALGEAQDRFALAVLVFRLLNGGLHPFQGVPQPGAALPTTDGERVAAGLYPYDPAQGKLAPPPGSPHGRFDEATQRLFGAAFTGPPAERPSAAQWQAHLRELLDEGLRPCAHNPDHARFGSRACVVCARRGPVREPALSQGPDLSETTLHRQRLRRPAFSLGRLYAGIAGLALVSVALLVAIDAFIPAPHQTAFPPMSASPADVDLQADADLQAAILAEDLAGIRRALARGARLDPNGGPDPAAARAVYAPLDDAVGYPGPRAGAVRCGGDSRARDGAYLQWAIYTHKLWIAWELAEADADLDALDRTGRTALMWAAANCAPAFPLDDAAVGALADAGRAFASTGWQRQALADLLQSRVIGRARTALMRGGSYRLSDAEKTAMIQNAGALELLLSRGADPDARDAQGRTALAYAVAAGNAATVQRLLDAGASPDAADRTGVTPLMVAADQAASPASDAIAAPIAGRLLAAGANPGFRDRAGRIAWEYVGERDATRQEKLRRESNRIARIEAGEATEADRGHGYVSLDVSPYEASQTLARLREAGQAGDPRRLAEPGSEGGSAAPLPPRPADLGDGPSAADPNAWADAPDASPGAWPPWDARSEAVEVRCDASLAGPVDVTLTLARHSVQGDSRVPRLANASVPAWGWDLYGPVEVGSLTGEKRRCLTRIQARLARRYTVRSEPERWPQGEFTVRLLPR